MIEKNVSNHWKIFPAAALASTPASLLKICHEKTLSASLASHVVSRMRSFEHKNLKLANGPCYKA
jgi:hypothetical protein